MILMTKEVMKKMPIEVEDAKNAPIIVKFFGGYSYTLYVVSAYALIEDEKVKLSDINGREVEDIYLFGYVTGLQYDEWGYTTLNQLKAIKFPPFGLSVERDRYFENHTVKEYIK